MKTNAKVVFAETFGGPAIRQHPSNVYEAIVAAMIEERGMVDGALLDRIYYRIKDRFENTMTPFTVRDDESAENFIHVWNRLFPGNAMEQDESD